MAELVTQEDWHLLREKARQQLPVPLTGQGLPSVLLPYQQALLQATNEHQVVIVEKSRRIGATWGIGADAVLTAGAARTAGGMDVFYIGYNLDMTREFIDTCAAWSKAFAFAASSVDEFLFDDGEDRSIQAFRIRFASGFEIVALCSRPRSLRGRQGYVIIDEAAFHDELQELLKAALALLIWGGKVLIISTHDGAENTFNELIQECRAGKKPYKVLRCTFDDALHDGLYERICLVTSKTWSAESEAKWREDIRSFYGDAAAEELDCVPRSGGGRYLSRVLLEARARPVPILRWRVDDAFVDLSDAVRETHCAEWIATHLRPLLDQLSADCRSFVGEDFARSGDLTIMWPLTLETDLRRTTPFVIELRNIPFREQEQILLYLCDHLPRFSGAALDARGNGQYLAERARQKYGTSCISQVMLTENWYREHMPRLKAALEDDKLTIPSDSDTIDDFRLVEMVRGVPRVPDTRTSSATGQRHGDAAIAAALAIFASNEIDGGPLEFAVEGSRVFTGAFGHTGGAQDFEGFQ